jgi:hypothetical protein
MSLENRESQENAAPAGAPQDARPLQPSDLNTTADLQGVFKTSLCSLLNDDMPVKKVNAVVAVGGKMLKTVELEHKIAERAGTKRKALALSS